jgi:FMN phosphatase YigB (HAD superfamily)
MCRSKRTYLFDWGNTLMVDFPGSTGKMRYWDRVEAVQGAVEVLEELSRDGAIYIATSAADSKEEDISAAFQMAGLDRFISGYFCKANLGVEKGTEEFFEAILKKLDCSPEQVVMVGDSMEKDILPAMDTGIQAVFFSPLREKKETGEGIRVIRDLRELIRPIL